MTAKNFQVNTAFQTGNSSANVFGNSSLISCSANLQMNTTTFQVGNATVNCTINSTGFALNGSLQGAAAMVLLANGDVSSAATLDVALTAYTASYRAFRIVCNNFRPASNEVSLYLRTSTDGGSTYSSGAANYAYSGTWVATAVSAEVSSVSATQIEMATGIGSNTYGATCGVIELFNPVAAGRAQLSWHFATMQDAGELKSQTGAGTRKAAADVDAIRFLFSSGNITSGNWAIYGLT